MNDFRIAINQICNQRQLPKEVIIDAIEAALVSAYKKNFGPNQNISVRIDPDTGKARVFIVREIVDEVEDSESQIAIDEARKLDAMAQVGGTIEEETKPRNFGRIAAQTAKQVILQRIREAERDIMYGQYSDREGEIINGIVRNVDERGNVILSLGKTEAILPRNEKIRAETYQQGQRLRTYVIEVQKTNRGPQILVSRSHRQFLRRLLELEVPEIFNGTVEIKAIAREPGSRSKVAVAAMQEGIDPVGSCVGVRGVRIQNVVNELSGEKIDVVAWDPDPGAFVANALSPAKVADVYVDEETKTATVVVPDNQLSLSIGKEGQNARLAAKLTGWRIDIKSVTEAEQEAVKRAEEQAARAAEQERIEAARAEARALLAEAETLIAEEAEIETDAMVEDELEAKASVEEAASEETLEATALADISSDDISSDDILSDDDTPDDETTDEDVDPAIEAKADRTVAEATELAVEPAALEELAETDLDLETFALEDLAELEDDEDFDEAERQKQRQKRWQYVRDEETGELVARRRRKRESGRHKDWTDADEWDGS